MPHTTYMAERMGTATIEILGSSPGPVEAGSVASFVLAYTAGYFGIDDTGSIKVVFRFASDMARPQFADPAAPGYTTVEASNGAVLEVAYDNKRNIRPWDKTLFIRVMRGFLREGDRIVVRFGDRRKGSPGIRVQTMAEPTFEFRVLVDPFATYNYCELPIQPFVEIVAGPPAKWVAVLPTLRRAGERFRLGLKAEDKWGNPCGNADARLHLKPSQPVANLPETVDIRPGRRAAAIEDLRADRPGDLTIDVFDDKGTALCRSNPLRIAESAELLHFWGDLHGQSEETIGTNSAEDYFAFARDVGFLDAMSHQGNDFQITTPFWKRLNELSAEYNHDHRFVVFPGFEWSGNTGLGGDRNVLFMNEGRQIHRSSHALVDDVTDVATDANSAEQLFHALKNEDCLVFAHIGGRYADIMMAHDIRLERSVEVHSDWGTFEWLLHDALEQGYRVGILANSDGHKGRPGASYPGASLFGAYGGLSCILAKELTRPAIMDALRRRHHYATTGCRMILDVRARFDGPAERYENDPQLGPARVHAVQEAIMGDIVRSDGAITLSVEALGSAPIERLEIRNRLETLETVRPYGREALGNRIRVIWEGSEYRGRGRQTVWDGEARLTGNSFADARPINFHNLDKKLTRHDASRVSWQALTTGGFGGFDAWLENPSAGSLAIDTALVKTEIPVASIGLDDLLFATNGGIRRRIRIFRLPDENGQRHLKLERRIEPTPGRDDALYVCATQEDGHLIWSSPIYVI